MKHSIALLLAVLLLPVSKTRAADPAPDGIQPDIEYGQTDGVSLKLDAFVPPGKGPFPACILVHGGGFTKGDKRSSVRPLLQPLSDAGFAWFSINYRLAPKHHWPACADDVGTAIRWVRTHADEYQIDVDRIALIGESAGGYLAGYVGATTTGDTQVAAVVPFYAALDREFQIRYFNKLGGSTAALFGVSELNDDTWQLLRKNSANTLIHPGMPPYLLIHGDHDNQVPLEQSLRFQQQMKAAGNRCDLIVIPNGKHGMGSWKNLDTDYQTKLTRWLQETLGPGK